MCVIKIGNKEVAEGEALTEALKKSAQYVITAEEISITCTARKGTDWLEYGIYITFTSKHHMYLAMIQRTVDAAWEFYS